MPALHTLVQACNYCHYYAFLAACKLVATTWSIFSTCKQWSMKNSRVHSTTISQRTSKSIGQHHSSNIWCCWHGKIRHLLQLRLDLHQNFPCCLDRHCKDPPYLIACPHALSLHGIIPTIFELESPRVFLQTILRIQQNLSCPAVSSSSVYGGYVGLNCGCTGRGSLFKQCSPER